ncbi:TPA: small membrane protein [Raoultella ornithinolytica]|nr:small membrane protein [Raoultella ornithinolytica]HDT6582444.1 small membrane protein [Raoultella ornithinolytica]
MTHIILLVLAVILFGVAIGFLISYLRDRRSLTSIFKKRK